MTAADALFRLAADAAAFHSRSVSGTVTVVPVLVDDIAPARLVFEALCQVTGGRLLDATEDELQRAVPGTADPIRRAAVEAALTTAPMGGLRRVLLSTTVAGETDAVFVDPPGGPDPSGGERTVLAVARAAAHADLDSHELAVILWEETAVDLLFRPALWGLAVDQLSGLPHATLRTLIAVVESRIDVALHCNGSRGFRLAIQGSRLLQRHPPEAVSVFAAEVAAHASPIVVFLGAGFSASSRLPLGNKIRDDAIRRLLGLRPTLPATSDELAHRFHEWMASQPGWLSDEERLMAADVYASQLTLEQVIRAERRIYPDLPTLREFKAHHDAVIGTPGQGVIDFARVMELAVGRLVVVEVNFDRLVEAHSRVPTRVFASDDEFVDAPGYLDAYLAGTETAIPILKVHGTIDRFDTCVIADDQTGLGVGEHKLTALRRLLNASDPTLWIYVGASMRDRDLRGVFGDEAWVRGVDERWVAPYLADTVDAFAVTRMPFWRQTPRQSIQSRLTTETSDAFFSALRVALE